MRRECKHTYSIKHNQYIEIVNLSQHGSTHILKQTRGKVNLMCTRTRQGRCDMTSRCHILEVCHQRGPGTYVLNKNLEDILRGLEDMPEGLEDMPEGLVYLPVGPRILKN